MARCSINLRGMKTFPRLQSRPDRLGRVHYGRLMVLEHGKKIVQMRSTWILPVIICCSGFVITIDWSKSGFIVIQHRYVIRDLIPMRGISRTPRLIIIGPDFHHRCAKPRLLSVPREGSFLQEASSAPCEFLYYLNSCNLVH